MKVGYARTSTVEQKAGLEAQLVQLREHGCDETFSEQCSSVKDRPEFERALKYLRKGDVLVVTKVDRLARSMVNLLGIVTQLNAKGAALKVLGTDIDTSTATGKLLLSLLGSFAAFERDIMLERQRVGIAKARADGKYKGRKPLAPEIVDKVRAMHADKRRPTDIARALNIGRTSVYRALGMVAE